MSSMETYYVRRNACGLTIYAESPQTGSCANSVQVVVENGVMVCAKHRTPLSACGCLDKRIWLSRGQKTNGTALAREEIA